MPPFPAEWWLASAPWLVAAAVAAAMTPGGAPGTRARRLLDGSGPRASPPPGGGPARVTRPPLTRWRRPTGGPSTTDLAATVTDRTRVLLLNTPHNPTGMVLDERERAAVAEVAVRHDVVVVVDEVYELFFDLLDDVEDFLHRRARPDDVVETEALLEPRPELGRFVAQAAAVERPPEHQHQLVRPVGQRQRGDQRLQQLALARAGGAGDQGVRPVLHEVDGERAAVAATEHGPRRAA